MQRRCFLDQIYVFNMMACSLVDFELGDWFPGYIGWPWISHLIPLCFRSLFYFLRLNTAIEILFWGWRRCIHSLSLVSHLLKTGEVMEGFVSAFSSNPLAPSRMRFRMRKVPWTGMCNLSVVGGNRAWNWPACRTIFSSGALGWVSSFSRAVF